MPHQREYPALKTVWNLTTGTDNLGSQILLCVRLVLRFTTTVSQSLEHRVPLDRVLFHDAKDMRMRGLAGDGRCSRSHHSYC